MRTYREDKRSLCEECVMRIRVLLGNQSDLLIRCRPPTKEPTGGHSNPGTQTQDFALLPGGKHSLEGSNVLVDCITCIHGPSDWIEIKYLLDVSA